VSSAAATVWADEAGDVAHGLGRGFEVATEVLGFAMARFGHEFEKTRASFTESGHTSRSLTALPGPGFRWPTNSGPWARSLISRGSNRAVPASQYTVSRTYSASVRPGGCAVPATDFGQWDFDR
jgi:hypothetical protein